MLLTWEDVCRVHNRERFAGWVCEQHNIVNEKLGKARQPCDIASLDARWKFGSAACR
jgi:FAD-linked sulfhydryl oxidase